MILLLLAAAAILGYALLYIVYTTKKSGLSSALSMVILWVFALGAMSLVCWFRLNS